MHIDIFQIFLIIIFGSLAYWANEKINNVPALKPIVSVIIVVVAVVMLCASVFGRIGTHIQIN